MDKILSVIVPAYNSEDYIERCLSPFVRADAETRKKLEIIIVNDGSTDGTEKWLNPMLRSILICSSCAIRKTEDMDRQSIMELSMLPESISMWWIPMIG